MSDEKTIILHGFDQDDVIAIVRAVKAAVPTARDAAFATSTPSNLDWKLSDLLTHVAEEHRYYRETRGNSKKE